MPQVDPVPVTPMRCPLAENPTPQRSVRKVLRGNQGLDLAGNLITEHCVDGNERSRAVDHKSERLSRAD